MKLNANTTLKGQKVILVPYRNEHVARYHEWMQDPALQEATASEPLSLEEEYDMQRKWAEDDDKCTFILLDRSQADTPGTGSHGGGMAGDVNFFFNDHDDHTIAEAEVMVAEPASRRQGLALEALQLFMAYGVKFLGVTKFRVKIGENNAASVALFSRKLGFVEVSRSAVFKEVTLELAVEGEVAQQLQEAGEQLKLGRYDNA
ncbi:GNAT domain-containing protein [Scenedesmus sp. NREL 46B-D3]|nr:GNAT domain-containing protein [Scenedesmus sp. NREL 46B-D3]